MAAIATTLSIAAAHAAETHSPAEIAAHRREQLAALWKPDEGEYAARVRGYCFLGKEPKAVADGRGIGQYFLPDAADMCVAALTRAGRDGQLAAYYRNYLVEVKGDPAQAESFAATMSTAVNNGNGKASIGGGWVIPVRPAMAFDAGFTLAYQRQTATPSGSFDEAKLKAITEACLGDQQEASTCWSVGYVYGARAYRRQVGAGQ